MPDVVIQNPILNTPFAEPPRHFVSSDNGITDEVADSRRVSSYFMPITAARVRGKAQLQATTEPNNLVRPLAELISEDADALCGRRPDNRTLSGTASKSGYQEWR